MPARADRAPSSSVGEDEDGPACTAFQGPKPTLDDIEEDSCIKILLATDTHVGYGEKDPIRNMDSINTFREILSLAKEHEVDLVLHAGDLFHDNIASTHSMWQVINSIREVCMGDKPVEIECLTDEGVGRRHTNIWADINYIDGNYNVAIPFFAIHGNHDDPQGTIGSEGPLCALDILSGAGLVNYIGRVDLPGGTADDAAALESGIKITPVVLRKGSTYLSLYGIGNIRDDRFHYELRNGRIQLWKPEGLDDQCFNICLVHQNRVPHERNSSVADQAFGDEVHLVVWGHEHDCINQACAEPVAGRRYYISQPGSSVATSLSKGESITKHVSLVKVQGKKFEMTPLRLKTVRPFIWEEISLQQAQDKDGVDLKNKTLITAYVKDQIRKLIQQADHEWDEMHPDEPKDQRDLPLIRLRVDYSGHPEGMPDSATFDIPNSHRVSQDFVGKVANPKDVLQFHRKATIKRKTKIEIDKPDLSDVKMDALSQAAEKLHIGKLVRRYLENQNLNLLPEAAMLDAVNMYVEKGDKNAVGNMIKSALKLERDLIGDSYKPHKEGPEFDDMTSAMDRAKQAAAAKFGPREDKGKGKQKKKKGRDDDDDDEDERSKSDASMASGGGRDKGKGKAKEVDSFAEDNDDDDDDDDGMSVGSAGASSRRAKSTTATAAATKSKATTSAAGAKRGTGKATKQTTLFNQETESGSESDEPPKKKQATTTAKKAAASTKRAAPSTTKTTKSTAASRKAAAAPTSSAARETVVLDGSSDSDGGGRPPAKVTRRK